MNSDNSGTKYVTRIDYLGPHQIATTGNGSFSINMGNINPGLFTITANNKSDCKSNEQKQESIKE